jgi:hypothetical protein
LKRLLPVLATVLLLAPAACGGDDDGGPNGPLALDERVPTEADAPDSKPDPVEKRVTVKGADEFISRLGDAFIDPTAEDVATFKKSGFVGAIADTRFLAESHAQSAPHIFSLVMQFDAEQGAQTALDFFHRDALRPCPETCATSVEEFDVDDIPDAKGVRRSASQEDIEATGDTEAHPFDEYEIAFADGPFAYRIQLNGPPGEVSEDEAEEIAHALYERVAAAPPAA